MRPARLKPRRSGSALVVSLGVHALVLAALVLSVRLPPPLVEPPAVQVSLIDLTRPAAVVIPLPPTTRPLSPREALAPPVDAPPPPPDLRGTADRSPQAPSPTPSERRELGSYMSFFQDNLKGCEREALMLLPAAEQERCRARIAAAALQAPRAFRRSAPPIEALSGLSAARRAALDAEVERRERGRGPGKAPMAACDGRLSNFGVGCLPQAE